MLENPQSLTNYNVIGNDVRECLKIVKIGQSAGKLLKIIVENKIKIVYNKYREVLLVSRRLTYEEVKRRIEERGYRLFSQFMIYEGPLDNSDINFLLEQLHQLKEHVVIFYKI